MHPLAERIAKTNILLAREVDAELQRLDSDLRRLWHFAGCPYDHCQTCIDDTNFIRFLEKRLGPPSARSVEAQRAG